MAIRYSTLTGDVLVVSCSVARIAGAVLVAPQLVCVLGIATGGALVADRVIGVAGADQDDRRTPVALATLLPEKVSPNTDTDVPFGAITDAPR